MVFFNIKENQRKGDIVDIKKKIFRRGTGILLFLCMAGIALFASPLESFAEEAPRSAESALGTSPAQEKPIALIHDEANIFTPESKQALEMNLQQVFAATKDQSVALRVYMHIFDTKSSMDTLSADVLRSASFDNRTMPVIVLYNKATGEWRYIIDERVSAYLSKPYLQNAVDSILKRNTELQGIDVSEFITRLSTTYVSAFEQGVPVQTEVGKDAVKVNEKNFVDHDFGKIETKKKETVNETAPAEEETDMMPLYVGILMLVIIGGAVFAKRKGSGNRR